MTIDKNNPKHLIADEGKVLARTVGYPLMGKQIYLGNVVVDGVKQPDKVENYIEIDEPKRKERDHEADS